MDARGTHASRRRRIGLAGLSVLALAVGSGCFSVGHAWRVDSVTRIEIGKTTRKDIQALLGDPWRTGVENGQRTWTYGEYRYSLFGPAMTRDLVVRFDDKDNVVSYNFNSTYPEDRAAMR